MEVWNFDFFESLVPSSLLSWNCRKLGFVKQMLQYVNKLWWSFVCVCDSLFNKHKTIQLFPPFQAGLSRLFHAGHLYNANFHSLSVDLRPICTDYPECTSSALELTQSLGVVFEPPVHNRGRQDWTLASLFDRSLLGACPLASVSKIFVDLSVNSVSIWSWILMAYIWISSKLSLGWLQNPTTG